MLKDNSQTDTKGTEVGKPEVPGKKPHPPTVAVKPGTHEAKRPHPPAGRPEARKTKSEDYDSRRPHPLPEAKAQKSQTPSVAGKSFRSRLSKKARSLDDDQYPQLPAAGSQGEQEVEGVLRSSPLPFRSNLNSE